jgi:alkylation response protein AidB-like acyl-CoA dehydrogenase
MTYVLSDEQRELATAVRALLQRHPTAPRVREAADTDGTLLDRDAWLRLAGELGVTGLLVSEEEGGAGSSLLDATVVLEEAGALLDSTPLLPAFIAAAVLADTEGLEDVRASIAEGSVVPSVAWMPDLDLDGVGPWDLGMVLHGADTDLVVVVTDGGIGIANGDRIRRDTVRGIDLTRSGARLTADTLRVVPLDGDAAARAAAIVAVLVTAEQVGVLRGALGQLRDYATIRTAFGRIIGSFQSIKHQLADLAIAVEVGQTLVRAGVAGLDDGETADAFAAAWWVSDRVLTATADTVRLHGGIGYTWEYDAQLYYRRVRGDQALLGPRGRVGGRLDAAIGLAATA